MAFNRAAGTALAAAAALGYLAVADDWRHTGEIVGVSAILLAGLLLLALGAGSGRRLQLLLRSMAAGALLGIPAGGALDSMLLGVGAGLAAGAAAGLLLGAR
jgi:hypothetical protein